MVWDFFPSYIISYFFWSLPKRFLNPYWQGVHECSREESGAVEIFGDWGSWDIHQCYPEHWRWATVVEQDLKEMDVAPQNGNFFTRILFKDLWDIISLSIFEWIYFLLVCLFVVVVLFLYLPIFEGIYSVLFVYLLFVVCCCSLCQYLVGGKQKILCWQISRCQKGFPNNFYPPVASNTISKQTTQSKRKTSKQSPISFTNTLTIIFRALMNIEMSGYVGAGSPDLDLAIAVEMSQVGAIKICQNLEIARDSFCRGSGCEAV